MAIEQEVEDAAELRLRVRLCMNDPRLEDLAAALVREEMIETLTGVRTRLPSALDGADLGGVFQAMRDLIRTMRSAPPHDLTAARPRLHDFACLDAAPLDGSPELDQARTILVQLSVFALFCLTVIEVFENGVFDTRRAVSLGAGDSPGSFEELGAARRELSISPAGCRATLARFREAWNLPPRPTGGMTARPRVRSRCPGASPRNSSTGKPVPR
ncbi:hypothetical protein [Actinomadura monticuli]|uniref:Uncharacterized protein n=1 Tax=Actinomadura monticuli TaxID=3097367 RepID=A0ABV4QFL9_9ACTN